MKPLLRIMTTACIALLFGGVATAQAIVTITNTPAVAIPDGGYIGIDDGNDGTGVDAGMVCSSLDFLGQPPSTVVSVSMEIGITHTWIGDLTVKLTSPDGSTLPVMVRPEGDSGDNPSDDTEGAAGFGDSSNLDDASPLTFHDAGTTDPEDMGSTLDTFGIVCLDDGFCDYFPNPDVAAGHPDYVADFAGFVGETANAV